MAKVLITGGAGFIGTNAANILVERGYEVVVLDSLALGTKDHLSPAVTFVKGDVRDRHDLDRVGFVDYVIHLASSSSAPMFVENFRESIENNVLGHVEVLEYAKRHGVRKFLFASTSSIYGENPVPHAEEQPVRPPNFYSVSKFAQENLSDVFSRLYGIEIIALRFMSVYGLHEEHKGRFANLVSQFIWGLEQEKQPVIYGDGTQERDFVNVRDVVQAFIRALETPKSFGYTVFNVGTSEMTSLRNLVSLLARITGKNVEPRFIENPISAGYIMAQQADLTKIHRELGFAATTPLEAGVREIIEYRKKHSIAPTSLSF